MKFLLMLITLLTLNVAQAEVYKHTNKQGEISYSDLPVKNSELINIPPVMSYPAPIVVKKLNASGRVLMPERLLYERIDVTHPSVEGMVRSNFGVVTVSYDLIPAMQKGDKLELYIDGVKRDGLTVEGLNRGTHTLYLQVVNEQGKLMISSSNVTFYLQRH